MTNKSLKNILFTGSIVAGSLFTANAASANQFNFTDLGSGSHLRTELLSNIAPMKYNLDLACGEKTKDDTKKENKTKEAKCGEGKCGEGKCGEGKCGEKKDSTKKTTEVKKTEVKKSEDKTKEAKCGEGKCGESKPPKK